MQPVLPRSITSSIRMACRKTWPEVVAKQRGRKAWSEGVAERRGPKTSLPNRGRGYSRLPGVCSPDLWRSVAWPLHQHCAMQMVLVLGASSKVNEQLQFAQQVYQNPCRTLALSQRLEYSARSPTSTSVGCAPVRWADVLRELPFQCISSGIAGDVEYALVLVDNGSAAFAGSCKHS